MEAQCGLPGSPAMAPMARIVLRRPIPARSLAESPSGAHIGKLEAV
jgi:hypothetical protein